METAKLRVVVTDQVFPDVDLERGLLAEIGAEVAVADGPLEHVLTVARDADALLNTYLPLDAAAIAELEQCRVIARYGIGVDNVDLVAASERGIVVTNVPDYCVEEVATHALAMILALVRRLPDGDRDVRAGGWGIANLRPIRRLSELTVGLIGLGRIGRELARRLAPLGVRIVAHDPYVANADGIELVDIDDLLARSDFISLHSPLTDETRGMIDGRALTRMKADAVLVNTSRGPLVVLEDLFAALRQGTIGGAALDVFETEPPDPARLTDVPNLLVTPHAAFYSEAAVRESQRKAATQVRKVLLGEPAEYQVNRPRSEG
ncbi:MAG: C-terminal binding protein [Acidimicrobiales bacterium]